MVIDYPGIAIVITAVGSTTVLIGGFVLKAIKDLKGEVKELHASVNGQSEALKRITTERDLGRGEKVGQAAERLLQAEARVAPNPKIVSTKSKERKK